MKPVRFGIMGAGSVANHFAKAIEITDGAVLTAVASRTPGRAEEFAARHNVPWAGSYEDMLAREDVDCVYIATTHNFHAENIRLCFRYGKHVVCEKPMVLCEADAASLFAEAREKGLFLMEAMWTRFLPTVQWAKKKITDGGIGDITSAVSVIGFRGDGDPESRLINPALAGGAVYDIGVYPLEVVSYLMGEPVECVKSFFRRHPVTGVDSVDSMLVRYPSADAMLQCMYTCNPKEFLLIHGTKGYIEIPGVNYSTNAFLYGPDRALTEKFHEDFAGGCGFVYELREIVRCLGEGLTESPVMPAAATVECARVFDTVLRGE